MISLAGKAALITGGSRGIGAATAQAGADIVFGFHKNPEAATQVGRKRENTARGSKRSRPT